MFFSLTSSSSHMDLVMPKLKHIMGMGRHAWWKAMVEYVDDMPGLAFVQFSSKKKCKESIGGSEGMNLGEIAWNMRSVEGKFHCQST